MRLLVPCLAFLAAFAGVSSGLERLVPERLKIEHFRTLQEEVDTVFLGTSHLFRQVDPALFDETMAAAGSPTRSYNFGVPSMRLPEATYMVNRFLRMERPALKRIFLEFVDWRTDLEEDNFLTERLLYWHDTAVTWDVLRAVWRSDAPLQARISLSWDHLRHYFWQAAHLGEGPAAWDVFRGKERVNLKNRPSLGPAMDGYLPLDLEKRSNFFKRRRKFLAEEQGEFAQSKRQLREAEWGGDSDPFIAERFRELREMTDAAGIELIIVLNCGYEKPPGLMAMAEQGDIPVLLLMNDIERYPAFYAKKFRFDLFHLNQAGAELYTRALAEVYLETQGKAGTPNDPGAQD